MRHSFKFEVHQTNSRKFITVHEISPEDLIYVSLRLEVGEKCSFLENLIARIFTLVDDFSTAELT